jgi:hypothetical protein
MVETLGVEAIRGAKREALRHVTGQITSCECQGTRANRGGWKMEEARSIGRRVRSTGTRDVEPSARSRFSASRIADDSAL